jgi:hypothetical protein
MQYVALVWAGMALLFICMLAMAVWGHRFGRRRVRSVGESAAAGTGMVEGALFALLGLLVAFTFATSYSRFNVRRDLAVQEANTIGTAYLRLDVLSASKQPELRDKFRDYVESRLAFWRHLGSASALSDELKRGKELQSDIWTSVIKATEDDPDGRRLLLPALNEMIDINHDAAERHSGASASASVYHAICACLAVRLASWSCHGKCRGAELVACHRLCGDGHAHNLCHHRF